MLMKIHNKGQVVIPVAIRKMLDIHIGEMLEVEINEKRRSVELRKPANQVEQLAGSLSDYALGKSLPTKKEIQILLAKGLAGEK